jgi:uncharacterized protein YqhQ
MALPNGVLVHGPRHWACAVRTEAGALKVASGRKTVRSVDVASPLLKGPARVAEVLAVLPAIRRALPEAELPFQQLRVAVAMAASVAGTKALRGSGLTTLSREAFASLLALVPAAIALRGTDLAAYHGAEHVSIGSYEHGEPRPREHERCGSHMIGPLLVATVAGNALASRVASTPRGRSLARGIASIGALGVASEVFSWMLRNPGHPLGRALAWPGHELQRRLLTVEPSPAQLEVAQAALDECLRLETA